MCLLREFDYWVAHLGHPIFSFNLRSVILLTLLGMCVNLGAANLPPLFLYITLRVGNLAHPNMDYSDRAISPCSRSSYYLGSLNECDIGVSNRTPPTLQDSCWSRRICRLQFIMEFGVIRSDDSNSVCYARGGRFATPKH